MREHPPPQQRQQQDGKNAKLKLRRPAGRWLAELLLGQAGEIHEQRADKGDAAGQAKPLEARQAVCIHHAVKLEQTSDVKQHDDSTNEKQGDRAAFQQAVKHHPQQHHGAGQATHEGGGLGFGLGGG